MKGKLATSKRRGHRSGFSGVGNSHSAELLSCMLGISNLRHLTDEDVSDLIDFIKYLVDEVTAEAFKEGWNAMAEYNDDMQRLTMAPTATEH